jgi:hypothetical protein
MAYKLDLRIQTRLLATPRGVETESRRWFKADGAQNFFRKWPYRSCRMTWHRYSHCGTHSILAPIDLVRIPVQPITPNQHQLQLKGCSALAPTLP